MSIRLSDLRYVLFPGENPREEWKSEYVETYQLWRKVWTATFQELDGDGTLYSDDLCRQHLVGSIMHGDRCVAVNAFHLVDFGVPTTRDDSWFKAWPDSAISRLIEQGSKVMVASNITVDPELRGEVGDGLRLRDIIVALCFKTLLATSADVLAGTARCNRGVDKACFAAGGTPIQQSKLHGVDVALLAGYRTVIEKHPFSLSVESLWRRRKIYEFADYERAGSKTA